jgi:hypothetical protein
MGMCQDKHIFLKFAYSMNIVRMTDQTGRGLESLREIRPGRHEREAVDFYE